MGTRWQCNDVVCFIAGLIDAPMNSLGRATGGTCARLVRDIPSNKSPA